MVLLVKILSYDTFSSISLAFFWILTKNLPRNLTNFLPKIEFIIFNISVHKIGRVSTTIILVNNIEMKYIYLL